MTEKPLTEVEFGLLPLADMTDWLAITAEDYFVNNQGIDAFAPFDMRVAMASAPAQAIANWALAKPNTRMRLARALALYVQRMPPSIPEIWLFVVDLARRLDATDLVSNVEQRLGQQHLLDQLEQTQSGFVNELCSWLLNISSANTDQERPHAKLARRLVNSGYLSDSKARLILLRLCEVDPDGWVAHFNSLRGLLHRQMTRIRVTRGVEVMQQVQDELAEQILDVIGPERLATDMRDLLFLGNASDVTPSDNWFHRALVERRCLIEPAYQHIVVVRSGARFPLTDGPLSSLNSIHTYISAHADELDEPSFEPISHSVYVNVFGATPNWEHRE
jgi:hypothetical protein